MKPKKSMIRHAHTQSGAALIIFLTIFVLGISAILLSELNNRSTNRMLDDQAQTVQVLEQAKEALIGFAATYADTHQGQPQGYLPCPDFDGDGSASTCSTRGRSVIGRFPWRTLGLPPLRDGSDECLWYAVSGTYKDNPKQILTSDDNGLFIVKNTNEEFIAGETETERAIAIIFAPGKLIEGQTRTITNGSPTICGSTDTNDEINKVSNYLDEYNNINNATGTEDGASSGSPLPTSTPSTFILAPLLYETDDDNGKKQVNTGKQIFNDTLVLITPQDFAPVYRMMDYWVAGRVRECLEEYANANVLAKDKYPWASGLKPNDIYFDYSAEPKYNKYFGRIPTPFEPDNTDPPPLSQTHADNSSMAEIWPLDPNFSNRDLLNSEDDELENLDDNQVEERLKELYGLDDEPDEDESESKKNKRQELEDLKENGQLKERFKDEREKRRCFNRHASLGNWYWGWWEDWKEMVFYAIHSWHSPNLDSSKVDDNILTFQGIKPPNAKMIVLVAGRRLITNISDDPSKYQQVRNTTSNKAEINNYLEEDNSNGDNKNFLHAPITSTFNDVTL